MKITVLGAGAWGTALAKVLSENQHEVTVWGHDPAHVEELKQTGRNERRLPGIDLPEELRFEAELSGAVRGSDGVIVAVPSRAFREITAQLENYSGIVASVTKGIEYATGLTMCGVLGETAPSARTAALSGPTFALEVARGIPTAIVAASNQLATAQAVQSWFHRPSFRVYTSTDLLGVEMGGALKNVFAIAAGVGDGLGFGDNSKAALVTRALVEMRRLGVAAGAQGETFSGLSGLGDLTVTCFSRLSRNRAFGERVGKGEPVAQILPSLQSMPEGYPTARSACHLAEKLQVETPIIKEVHAMLYEGKPALKAVQDLISRDSKAEDW